MIRPKGPISGRIVLNLGLHFKGFVPRPYESGAKHRAIRKSVLIYLDLPGKTRVASEQKRTPRNESAGTSGIPSGKAKTIEYESPDKSRATGLSETSLAPRSIASIHCNTLCRSFALCDLSHLYGLSRRGARSPGPLKVESAQMAGDIHDFADKK